MNNLQRHNYDTCVHKNYIHVYLKCVYIVRAVFEYQCVRGKAVWVFQQPNLYMCMYVPLDVVHCAGYGMKICRSKCLITP